MSKKNILPWESDFVQAMTEAKVIKGVNLQLPIEYMEKLKWLSEQTGKSQQKIIREALFPKLDREIKKVIKND